MKIFTIIIFLLIAVTSDNFGQQSIFNSRKSKVEFISDAPFELISASSEKLSGIIDAEKRTFAFSIPIGSFKGFNSPLQQEHFYENYLEEKEFPISKFEGKIIESVNFFLDGNYSVRAKGKLNIHGVEQERIIKVQLRVSKGVVYVNSEFTVMLQDHNINIPKVVLQKIADEIKVKVVAEFVKKA